MGTKSAKNSHFGPKELSIKPKIWLKIFKKLQFFGKKRAFFNMRQNPKQVPQLRTKIISGVWKMLQLNRILIF